MEQIILDIIMKNFIKESLIKQIADNGQIIIELLKFLGVAIVGAIPGIIALLSQRSKEHSEKPVTEASALEKLTTATGGIQDVYQDLLKDIKCEMESLKSQNVELLKQNIELSRKVEKLIKIVKILVKQLNDANISPEVDIDKELED